MLTWIHNVLTERTHCTRVGNCLSSTKYLTSGVVQGSCLGPIRFVIYISDIVSVFDQCCVCKLYADDLKLLYTHMNIGYAHIFRKCIDNVTLWSRTWQLDISHKNILYSNLVLLQMIVIVITIMSLLFWVKSTFSKILVFL